jgi:transcriptional regulator with XRE-family HTH domain
MSLAREVGRCIRALRRRRGLTQAALAERIDRSEVPLRAGDDARPETERRAREVAAVTALAHSFDDPDLALAVALLGAVAKAAPERRRPGR